MKRYIKPDENGRFDFPQRRGANPVHEQSVNDYLNLWNELIAAAMDSDELQTIFALLRFRGTQSAGWDTFENTALAFKGVMRAGRKADGTTQLNMMLWLYGHIVESSEHYETIANMVSIAGGDVYRGWNFPKIKTRRGSRELTPNEKIIEIRSRCQQYGLKDYARPLAEVLDKDLRNAVYHSDYSVHAGAVRFRNAKGFDVEYSQDKVLGIINKALAMHESIKNLLDAYVRSYNEPKIIDAGRFAPGTNMKIQVIVRKDHGLAAIQELPILPGSVSMGIYKPGDQKLISQGVFRLPASRTDAINRRADRMPVWLAIKYVKFSLFVDKLRGRESN